MRGTWLCFLALVIACAPRLAPAEAIPALRLPDDVRAVRYWLEMKIDPGQPRFSGKARIEVELFQQRQILWLHGSELEVSAASVRIGEESLPAKWEQVNDDGVVKLSLPRAIGPGPATIEVEWARAFEPHAAGLFVSQEAGLAYAFTQLGDLNARRVFPSFNQPGFLSHFNVTLVVPSGLVAVANTPQVAEESAGPGWKRTQFAETLPLTANLIAWAVGPFDVVDAPDLPGTPLRARPVPMRGIAPKGRAAELEFGLKAAADLLLQEERYFGVAYPYPKLDSVMLPDATYALENAGEIHYSEDIFLSKAGVTSGRRLALIATVIAHEQAHQWFGDLVMMPWWDDAWLNESFATWMAAKMIQEWKPQWNAGLELQRSAVAAMKADALPGARAIRQSLTSAKNIPEQFDELTYQKGGAVLTMFEHYLGTDKFRRGISEYIAGHAQGTGSTDDLLAALSPDVVAPFHSFLDQTGVPLVQVSLRCPSVTLKQSRFLPLGSTVADDRLWQIPVCLRLGKGAESRVQCAILGKAEEAVALPECPDWVMPNADAAGYYRWSMPGADLQKLREARLSTAERTSSAQSLNAAVASGALPAADALRLLEPIARDPEEEVAAEAMALLRQTRDHFLPAEDAARLNAYASQLLAPVLARLGYSAKPGDSSSTRRLRAAVLELLGWAENPEVVRNLTRLGRAYAMAFDPTVIDADLARLALSTAVEHGDDAFFDGLRRQLALTTDGELRVRIISALASSPRGLALSLDPGLRQQETSVPLFVQGADSRTRDAAWAFIQAHYDELIARLPELGGVTLLPQVVEGYCDAAKAGEIEAFFGPRAGKHPGMEQTLRLTVESIRLCAAQAAAQSPSARAFVAGVH